MDLVYFTIYFIEWAIKGIGQVTSNPHCFKITLDTYFQLVLPKHRFN